MPNKPLTDPRSLHTPNTGDLRQPRLAKSTIKPAKIVKSKIKLKLIPLATLMGKRRSY